MKKSLRKLMFAGMALVVSLGASAQTLEKVWLRTSGVEGVSDEMRFATALDGKLIVPDKANQKIVYWDENTQNADYLAAPGIALGLNVDDAGNIIYNTSFSAAGSSTNFVIIPADGSENVKLTLELPSGDGARFDQLGHVLGDVMSEEGGYMFIGKSGQKNVDVIKVVKGVQAPVEKCKAVDTGFSLTTTAVVHPMPGVTVANIDAKIADKNAVHDYIAFRERSNGLYIWNGTEYKQLSLSTSIEGSSVSGASINGFDLFSLQGKTYYVCPVTVTGASAERGMQFGVFAADGKMVACSPASESVPGVYDRGSIAVESIDDCSVYIYRYCPTIGVAKYKFSVPEPAKLYAVGEFQGWNAVEPAEFTYADGKYTLTIGTTEAPVSSFKMSTTKNTEANDWNSGFNVGVICVADDKVVVPGEEFNLYVGGNADINFDWASVWTVTVDLENNTLSAEAATAKALYITGAGFEPAWDPANAIELTYNSDAKVFETPLTAANTEFKISTAKAGWDDGFNANAFNAGDVALTSTPTTLYKGNHPGNANIKVAAPADNTKLVVDLVNMTICVVADGTTGIEDVELESASVVYYNLQGVEVANDALVPGVYVKVQGAKATKVVVK